MSPDQIAEEARQAQREGRRVRYTVPVGGLPRCMPKGRLVATTNDVREVWEFDPARVLEFLRRNGFDKEVKK